MGIPRNFTPATASVLLVKTRRIVERRPCRGSTGLGDKTSEDGAGSGDRSMKSTRDGPRSSMVRGNWDKSSSRRCTSSRRRRKYFRHSVGRCRRLWQNTRRRRRCSNGRGMMKNPHRGSRSQISRSYPCCASSPSATMQVTLGLPEPTEGDITRNQRTDSR